ncbi:MAG TPA: hypothetical protein VHH53_02770, partial [Pseudonocardiaceae bacterium]|nr:hypothetical protein [Pseudonocardiaceae bacterium]
MFDTSSVQPAVLEDAPVEQILDSYQRLAAAVDAGAPVEMPPSPDQLPVDPAPWSTWTPSGWLGVELGQAGAVPAALSDIDLIEGVIAFDRMASWAGARQAALLAEFARRRPDDHPLAANSDIPSRASEFAADEVALALRLSRTTAANRLVMAETLAAELSGTLAAWEAGVIDVLKARGPGKPLVSVIVPITMLLGLDDQPAELVGYGPIPADLAREIAAEGTW